jgi:ubiquitin-conjugating enzyme E2 J1
METDAKGQLGGLDTSEAERRRCADASGNWKCGVCGQSNREILAERAEAAKAKEDAEGSKRVEEEVPKELTINVKEQDSERPGVEKPELAEESGAEEAELAEGFVQTAPLQPDPPIYPPARPAQGVPQPTGSASSGIGPGAASTESIRHRNVTTAPQAQTMRQRAAEIRRSTDGVPLWIDRAIVGVAVCLTFMVLKMLLTS